LIEATILDLQSARDILATFGVKGIGSLAGSGNPLTASGIANLKIGGDPAARAKFIKLVTAQIGQRNGSLSVVAYLLQLLLDNEKIDAQNASQLAMSFNFGVAIQIAQTQHQQQVIHGNQQIIQDLGEFDLDLGAWGTEANLNLGDLEGLFGQPRAG